NGVLTTTDLIKKWIKGYIFYDRVRIRYNIRDIGFLYPEFCSNYADFTKHAQPWNYIRQMNTNGVKILKAAIELQLAEYDSLNPWTEEERDDMWCKKLDIDVVDSITSIDLISKEDYDIIMSSADFNNQFNNFFSIISTTSRKE